MKIFEKYLINKKITDQHLAVAMTATWCISLVFPALILNSGNSSKSGFEVFLWGWLSPLVNLNFAWYANIFLLYGIFCLHAGKIPKFTSVLTSILAVKTFLLSRLLMDEGGGHALIYGYGWGVLLWFFSIFIFQLRVAIRKNQKFDINIFSFARLENYGLIISLAALIMFGWFTIYDRLMANKEESSRLSVSLIKRGAVCPVDIKINKPIENFSGPLEIKYDKLKPLGNASDPFLNVRKLLDYGIPMIRIDDQDYFYMIFNLKKILVSQKASGKSMATLYIDEDNDRKIIAKLISNEDHRTVFDQIWTPESKYNAYLYCPNFFSYPNKNQQPRKMLLQSLGLPDQEPASEIEYSADISIQKVKIINQRSFSSFDERIGILDKKRFSHYFNNHKCPEDIGWDESLYDYKFNIGKPFKFFNIWYYMDRAHDLRATCQNETTYLYSIYKRDTGYLFHIQKRFLKDFRIEWVRSIEVMGLDNSANPNDIYIETIEIKQSFIQMEFIDKHTGQLYEANTDF